MGTQLIVSVISIMQTDKGHGLSLLKVIVFHMHPLKSNSEDWVSNL